MAVSSLQPMADAAPPDKIEFIDLKSQQARIRARIDRAIARVLDHGQYIMGPEVGELERQLAAFSGAKHAISCASGTDALLIAMMAKGIGPGDAVICPDFTYTATPETVALIGATPVFCDVEAASFNIDPETIEGAVAAALKAGLKPAGIIAVDLFGLPADYGRIRAIAARHGLWVMADAAQSFGASLGAARVGTLGDMTATSFFPAKPLGCYGDGGALFTDDDDLAEVMRSIRLHGKGGDKYDIVRVGINGRLDTLQAAILIEKLAIFADEITARNRVAEAYRLALTDVAAVPEVPTDRMSVWAQYTLRIKAGRRDEMMRSLAAAGIPTNVYYPRPLSQQTAYRHYPVAGNGNPVAARLCGEVLSLPMHPYLSEVEQARVVEGVRGIAGRP